MVKGCRSLGYRERGFIFRHTDYTNYEDLRSAFLEEPHARSAIQAGGIVWRLAVEAMGAESALLEPSPSAHVFGDVLTSPGGLEFVNDRLTEDEMDLLCGKYCVYTGA
jgi:hypothetical protein